MRRPRYSTVEYAQAREMWDEGWPTDVIAAWLRIARSSVQALAQDHEWTARPKGPPPRADWEAGQRLWDSGLSATAIARRMGCSRQAVNDRAQRHGWPPR